MNSQSDPELVVVESRITEALSRRRSQRGFVDELAIAWESLTNDVEGLVEALQTVERSARDSNGVTPDRTQLRDSIAAFLHSDGGPGTAADLRRRMERCAAEVVAVRHRINRETVNLGVVGLTKSGKSTLLRSITGLPRTVIPSSDHNPTTAAPSQIYHESGPFAAWVMMHSWESFRDGYLAHLHASAKLREGAPRTPSAFRGHRYDQLSARTGEQRFLDKLRQAQASFDSYADLLHRTEPLINLSADDLAPFVAYPVDDSSTHRPYHAVHNVRIWHEFRNVAVSRLGLVDLPGSGESGLDVDKQFLSGLKNDVDLLLLLKRPTQRDSFFTEADEEALESVDAARGGVKLADAVFIVINPDLVQYSPGSLVNAERTITEKFRPRQIRVITADVSDDAEVASKILHPALQHLAARLAEMDRDAVIGVLDLMTAVVRELSELTGTLSHGTERWQEGMPSEERRLLELADKLCDRVARRLRDLMQVYDDRVAGGDLDPDLGAAISDATDKAKVLLTNGFGVGREQWVDDLHKALARRPEEAREIAYNNARAKVAAEFDKIDVSLSNAVERLWGEITDLLRGELTTELVPMTDEPLRSLLAVARARRTVFLPGALDDLLQLKIEYGSIVLRVTRPILRSISVEPPVRPSTSFAAASVGQAVAGAAADAAVAAAGVPIQVSPIISAAAPRVAAWWEDNASPRARATSPSSGQARSGQPSSGQPGARSQQRPASRAAEIHEELAAVTERVIGELNEALLAEARLMPRALAAAVDRFHDRTTVSDQSEQDFKDLCSPVRKSVWPGEFDGGAAQLAADLSAVIEQIHVVDRAREEIARLERALRMGSPTSA